VLTREKAAVTGLVLMLAACAGSAPPPPSEAESAPPLVIPEAAASAELTPAVPEAALDTSLTWPIYRAAGVPEIERVWSVEDYRSGVQVFGKMAGVSRAELPRHDSQRSGSVFARLVNPDNFAAVAAMGEVEARARLGEDYLAVFPGLLQLYSPASDALDFAVEQGELIVTLFELLKLALDASRSYAGEDTGWRERYEQQKAVTVGVLRGVGSMLREDQRYPAELRQRLKGEAARLGPELASHLSADQRQLVDDIITP
jgi:hypothetical protein